MRVEKQTEATYSICNLGAAEFETILLGLSTLARPVNPNFETGHNHAAKTLYARLREAK